MSRVLVTGASGFLGRRLVPALLQSGHSVLAAGRDPEGLSENGADVAVLDITHPEDFPQLPNGIDTIIHAAVDRPARDSGWSGVAESLRVNALGTLNLLQYAEDSKVAKLVYCSTMSVYALPQDVPIKEDGQTYPVLAEDSNYGISKLAGELLCARGVREGRVNCLNLRLGRIYGPGETASSLFSLWADQARNGEEIVVHGNGERSLDFIYIDDAVRAICLSVETDWEGQTINVSGGVEITWRNLAESIGAIFSPLGDEVVVSYVDRGDKTRCYLDVDKARELLGFTPSFSLREGLEAWKAYVEASTLTLDSQVTSDSIIACK